MAITNGSTVKFGYTSVYNNLTSQLKTNYNDSLLFDADTLSILFDGRNYGTNLNGNAVIITLNNFKDPTIWNGTNKHYIIKSIIWADSEDITIEPGANSIIEFMPGACIGIPYEENKLIPVTEYDITFKLNHCLIIAPLKLIFSDHCIIVGLFHRNEYIPVEWFGGKSTRGLNSAVLSSNYALHNSNAIKHALESIENTPLLLSGEFYPIHSGIVLNKTAFSNVNIEYEDQNVTDSLIINIRHDIKFSLEIICRGSIVTDNTFSGATWGTGSQLYKNAAIVVQGDNKRITINGALIVNANSHDTAGIDVTGKSNNIFINHIVKSKDTETFTKQVYSDSYTWDAQKNQYIGEGNGVQITSNANYNALWGSNITVNYIGGFNNAVVMNVHGITSNLISNNTFNIGYILCNNGFDISYTATYDSSTIDLLTVNDLGVEPAISNNVINYSGYTTNELEETAFIPTEITYTNYPDETIVTPDEIVVDRQDLYTNPTLFKIRRDIDGLSGSLLENMYTKPVFARNTININNTGGIWETFIDAEWMCSNVFNIQGICTDCKKIILSGIDTPNPNPTYVVSELVIDVTACSIYNPTGQFVRLNNSDNNIFNAPERFPFPYNLVTMETPGLYNTIHNAMSVEDILGTLDSNNDFDTPDNSIDQLIHFNFLYPTCKILCRSNTTLYVLDYWKKPYGIYETTDTLPGLGVDEELIIINDPSTGSKFGTLYPIKECRGGTAPRTLTNCYYYDMYNFVDIWNINKQLNP